MLNLNIKRCRFCVVDILSFELDLPEYSLSVFSFFIRAKNTTSS